jgi:hypothetical protein
MCYFPNRNAPWPSRLPPTSKQVDNLSGHNPRHPGTTEERTPQSRSHIAVENKMIHELLNLFIHIPSVYHDNMPLPKIVQGKNLAKNCEPHKKCNP